MSRRSFKMKVPASQQCAYRTLSLKCKKPGIEKFEDKLWCLTHYKRIRKFRAVNKPLGLIAEVLELEQIALKDQKTIADKKKPIRYEPKIEIKPDFF